MKFGGHETFFLRPGWLTKGLYLVRDVENVVWNSDAASDAMGVGRNMSKSIGWWLSLAGLVHRPARGEALALTDLGMSVLRNDPFLTHAASWWFIHLNMTLGGADDIFSWFFLQNRDNRFAREALQGRLMRHLQDQGEAAPAAKTLQRDVAVLLQSYARSIPAEEGQDPEDNLDCPLRRLGLMVHRRDLGDYERRATPARLPAALSAAALNAVLAGGADGGRADVPMDFVGPIRRIGRIFGFGAEQMAETVMRASDELGPDLLAIRYLAGQRVATVRRMSSAEWHHQHFNQRAATPLADPTASQAT